MRWLIIVLLVSTVALLAASAGLAHHVLQARKRRNLQPPVTEKPEDV